MEKTLSLSHIFRKSRTHITGHDTIYTIWKVGAHRLQCSLFYYINLWNLTQLAEGFKFTSSSISYSPKSKGENRDTGKPNMKTCDHPGSNWNPEVVGESPPRPAPPEETVHIGKFLVGSWSRYDITLKHVSNCHTSHLPWKKHCLLFFLYTLPYPTNSRLYLLCSALLQASKVSKFLN